MFEFCPACGRFTEGEQRTGQAIVCKHCGTLIGVVAPPQPKVVVDEAEELVRQGTAARCLQCGQLVAVKARGDFRTLVVHYAAARPQTICPGSGQAVTATAPPPRTTPGGKDLGAFMTRDRVRLVWSPRDGEPRVEELTLEYLDKADRVRTQIEALREILGPDFRLQDYPAALGRPSLAVWGSSAACVVGKRHERGGYQTLTDAEIAQVVDDLRRYREKFFS
jgi:hypothetical protein